jgi:hypothetical protein
MALPVLWGEGLGKGADTLFCFKKTELILAVFELLD